jgi:hypothetical protein
MMKSKTVFTVATATIAALMFTAGSFAQRKPTGATAPLTDIPKEKQIEMAMSAAPPHIAQKATVYVLGANGYVKARTGTNGFSCLVERRYIETLEPSCYDAEGSATTLQARLYREELRAAKTPEGDIDRKIDDRYKSGEFKPPSKPGFVYMLSTHNKVHNDRTNAIIKAPPHLMFYAPYATQKEFGEFVGPQVPWVMWEGRPDAYIMVTPELIVAALQRQNDPPAKGRNGPPKN